MPYIKQITGLYRDNDSIYDLVNYCLNHDLRDYYAVNIPVQRDILLLDQESRKYEIQNMAWFWNTFLDIRCCNYGKRLNHFVFGMGYYYTKNIDTDVHLVLQALGEFMYERGLLGVVAYHVTPEGYHHIHILIGKVNIYGNTWYKLNLSAMSILWYLKQQFGWMSFRLVDDESDD